MSSFTGPRLESSVLPPDPAELQSQRDAPFFETPKPAMDGMAGKAAEESVVSSNRMEGVLIHPRRLQPLISKKEPPSGHAEQEVVNYREALWRVHESHSSMRPTPKDLQDLHARLSVGVKGASEWRTADSEAQAAALCDDYRAFRASDDLARRLLGAAAFTLDFDTLRLFKDDKPRSRLTRLLTVLALYKCGLMLPYYVSVERLMEASKVEYAAALAASARGFKEGRNDVRPWFAYLAVIVQWAYWEFEAVAYPCRPRGRPEFFEVPAEKMPAPGSSHKGGRPAGREEDLTPQVLAAVDRMPKVFTREEVEAECTDAGRATVKKVLLRLKDEGMLRLIGKGRGARWEKTEKYAAKRGGCQES